MASKNGTTGYGDLLEATIAKVGLPNIYTDEKVFAGAVIDKFKEDPVWHEIQRRLLMRMQELYNEWVFQEDPMEMKKRQGRGIELVYLLTLPDALKAIDKDKIEE